MFRTPAFRRILLCIQRHFLLRYSAFCCISSRARLLKATYVIFIKYNQRILFKKKKYTPLSPSRGTRTLTVSLGKERMGDFWRKENHRRQKPGMKDSMWKMAAGSEGRKSQSQGRIATSQNKHLRKLAEMGLFRLISGKDKEFIIQEEKVAEIG